MKQLILFSFSCQSVACTSSSVAYTRLSLVLAYLSLVPAHLLLMLTQLAFVTNPHFSLYSTAENVFLLTYYSVLSCHIVIVIRTAYNGRNAIVKTCRVGSHYIVIARHRQFRNSSFMRMLLFQVGASQRRQRRQLIVPSTVLYFLRTSESVRHGVILLVLVFCCDSCPFVWITHRMAATETINRK